MGETRLKAPAGKFRVVGVDTFEGPFADYIIGDYDTLNEAIAIARAKGGEMNPCYVYNDRGKNQFSAGSY